MDAEVGLEDEKKKKMECILMDMNERVSYGISMSSQKDGRSTNSAWLLMIMMALLTPHQQASPYHKDRDSTLLLSLTMSQHYM